MHSCRLLVWMTFGIALILPFPINSSASEKPEYSSSSGLVMTTKKKELAHRQMQMIKSKFISPESFSTELFLKIVGRAKDRQYSRWIR